ncbi:MAG: T9SS C-terminal target domain-containing protein [Calditrichaeota bacterium]|nr:MAG: T9SS C-terminal target domain-containing protein [Calditrichota bacterium]
MFGGVSQTALAQTYIIPRLQRDDFKDAKSWWSMQATSPQSPPTINNGYILAELVDPLVPSGSPAPGPVVDYPGNMRNVGFATVYNTDLYGKDDTLTAIIRLKTLNTLPVGSRGWGFWRTEAIPVVINQAVWFFEQKAHPDSSWAASETWWRARIHRTVDPDYDFYVNLDGTGGSPYNYDNQQWHTYKVVRFAREYYRMYVDGVQVINITPSDFPDGKILNEDFSFHCWNDNFVYHHTQTSSGADTIAVTGNKWTGTSRFVVDFVEILKGNYQYGYSRTPVGAIALREVINEIDDGIADGTFKGPYTFNAVAGKTVVIATGKAEEIDSYGPDDDMKMILDSQDFGYNTTRSWDGLVDAGTPKTIVIDTSLSAGNHTLEFQSLSTPILYDATVLSSANGSIVLNQDVNSSAPSGSNNTLWQSFNFTAEAGEVVIYVSGSADEEPGWDHKNANIDSTDDDELRLELDGYDFGWGTDSASFVGNTLFGDFKTICIRKNVASGSHTLKLYANETPYVHKVLVYAANGDVSLPVQLISFSAEHSKDHVSLNWRVASEIGNAGFNILRAVTGDDVPPPTEAYVKINPENIPGRGNANSAQDYSYIDAQIPDKGETFWYKLEDVSYSGKITTHGPVSVQFARPVTTFRLRNNYPNPFNPVTTIPFELAENRFVEAVIYDLRGRKVRTLAKGEFNPGAHLLEWDARDDSGHAMSSGIYYLRVRAGSRTQWLKMTLLR